jgi:hypothetical protein
MYYGGASIGIKQQIFGTTSHRANGLPNNLPGNLWHRPT